MRSKARSIRVKGHNIVECGAPHDDGGALLPPPPPGRGLAGRCKCRCGLLSPVLASVLERKRWHLLHREALAGVPWGAQCSACAGVLPLIDPDTVVDGTHGVCGDCVRDAADRVRKTLDYTTTTL